EFCLLDYPIRELSGMTLGIVGYGELGKGVARVAELFGMEVLIARRRGAREVAGDGRVDFDRLLSIADIITLHCPLNDDTRNMFGHDEFLAMKPEAILINTARGGLVDSAALVHALDSGAIGAAAIDVLPQEPPVAGDPLLEYRGNNLVVTPHIAWATRESRQRAINELGANVQSFLGGRRRNRVV
ncbi:MAG: glycerate dehydrogenase, partial [Gammaproteobacteria bacterium]|nr:glycerate dehydrogenase [Gammaproteobacteria bacterium]